ncbi:MAG: adenylate/guanylate cyclase domain-containing protein [Spirochaetes bacterium]|nr:adenylate/guanylate cyclase domain-containing protein [Spirochaetota bacterium]
MKRLFQNIQTFILKSNYAGLIIGISAFLIILILSSTNAYQLFELKLYDLRFALKHTLNPIPQASFLTFLDIDDHSIANIGEFPWPRSVYAKGLATLMRNDVRNVTFDTQFPDDSPLLIDRAHYAKITKERSAPSIGKKISDLIINNDQILAKALAEAGNAIIPFSFPKEIIEKRIADEGRKREIKQAFKLFIEKASIPVPQLKEKEFRNFIDPERKSILPPIPEFIRSAKAFGFVDSDFDIDGIARKIRLVRVFEGRLFFHMALVMLMDLCNVKKENIEIVPGRHINLKNAIHPIAHRVQDIIIPIDDIGRMYINWAGDFFSHFNHLPFYALLEYDILKEPVDELIASDPTIGNEVARIQQKISNAREMLQRSKDAIKNSLTRSEMLKLGEQLYHLRMKYAQHLLSDIEKLKTEYNKRPDAQLENQIETLKNYPAAIELVAKVEKLHSHVAIIGLTATGTQDLGVTPLSSQYLMVGTYHNVINTILQQQFIRKISPLWNMLSSLIIGIAMGIIIQRLNARQSLVTIMIGFLSINLFVIFTFVIWHLWVDQLGISLAFLLPSLFIGAIKFVSEESQKRFIKNAFAHYLSPKVIDAIIQNPDSFKLGGESRIITTFFSDVAKFSTISEKLTPTELVSLLNEYLSEMTDIILRYDGTVDKYEGDAIMAFWGAPHALPDHALRACFAAIDMQQRLVELRSLWRIAGKDELFVRIGMNTGEAVVGNMGSRTRMDYTAMGDSVNLASRLEGANKFYGTSIMISENVYREVKDQVVVRPLDRIRVVGKAEPITVYELICRKNELTPEQKELLDIYLEGHEHFTHRDWNKARASFKAALKINPTDGPCLKFIERCNEYLKNPPSKNWDGVYTLKAK